MDIPQQLSHARCTHPFAQLGMRETSKGVEVSAFVPDASKIQVVDAKSGKSAGSLKAQGDGGFFSAVLRRKQPFAYRLKVTSDSGEREFYDPYQFQEQAFHAVHYVDHAPENLYHQLGAQLVKLDAGEQGVSGTRFAVFAPNASAVSVLGDFNWWDGRYHPMQKTDMGYWVLFVPGIEAGTRYKFQIKDAAGNSLPHKADPVGFYADQYPSHASIVFDHDSYKWQDSEWLAKARTTDKYQTPMSVYEVHLGSWKKNVSKNGLEYLSYRELAKELIPYVKNMGFTHVELLPVSEHPFDGSWGYQPVGLFAPTSRFGNPDDFKYFVDQCHQQGIGVIIDWVPAHFPEDGHGLARFDGTHVYEYSDPRRGWHPDWNSCIYDFGKDTVRQFLVASALYWLDKFHVDGLRVDAVASMLYLDYSRKDGEWIPNVDGGNENYEAISLLRWMNTEVYAKYPHAMTIAEESTSFPKVSKPVFEGGLGFGFKWNMGWMHDTLHYISKDPAYRRYHHGEITFSMVYAWNENFVLPISHDEVVHGKGSLLRKMPGDEWQQAANQRCYAAFMYAHPGKKLNFMGNEIGQSSEWNHDSSVNWHLLEFEKHEGIQRLYKDLNQLYKNTPALYQCDHDAKGFEWIDHENAEQSVLSFVRKSADGKQKLYCVTNFTPLPRDNFRLGVLDKGNYRLLLNTDSEHYWGSNYEAGINLRSDAQSWNHRPHSIRLNLPPLATLFVLFEA